MRPAIFSNNQQPNQSKNLFTANQTNQNNIFTANQSQPSNQNNSYIQNQPNPNSFIQTGIATNIGSKKPQVQDSLQQNNSFIRIRQKIRNDQKLNADEISFVKKGLLYFKKDDFKSEKFKNQKNKQPYLGFLQQIGLKGQVPKCKEIDQIWNKIIRHFGFSANTHEMNGYFILKKLLKTSPVIKNFYRSKRGLQNKVYQVNEQYVKTFYVSMTAGNKINVNKDGQIYQYFVQTMIIIFYTQWEAYLDIIELVANIPCQNVQEKTSGKIHNNQSDNNRPSIQQKRYLRFKQLQDDNILDQFWKCYKQLACSTLSKQQIKSKQQLNENMRKKVFTMKQHIFIRVSKLIGAILQSKYNQEVLLQKHSLPLIQVVNFIQSDIKAMMLINNLQRTFQEQYISNALNIILFLIPFSVFIKDEKLERFFNSQYSKQRFNRYITVQQKNQIIESLLTLQMKQFKPLQIFAVGQKYPEQKRQFRHLNYRQYRRDYRNDSQQQVSQRSDEEYSWNVQRWQEQLQSYKQSKDIFYDKKWRFLTALLVQRLEMKELLDSNVIRSLFVKYCKNILKNRVQQFLSFWDNLINLQNQIQNYHRYEPRLSMNDPPSLNPQTQTQYGKLIINNIDFYYIGKFLKEIVHGDYVEQGYSIIISILQQQIVVDQQSNFTDKVIKLIEYNSQIKGLLNLVVSSISQKYSMNCFKTFQTFYQRSLSSFIDFAEQQNLNSELQIKFICTVIKKNLASIANLEKSLFMINQMTYSDQIDEQYKGLKICSFLCLLMKKINMVFVKNIKCIRYIISAIDHLFCYPPTRKIMVFALAIFFPIQRLQKKKKLPPDENVIVVLRTQHLAKGQQRKQIKKLRLTVSHHLNHMIRYSDSIDQYFKLQSWGSKRTFSQIQDQVVDWKFNKAIEYLTKTRGKLGAISWFYNFAQVLTFKELEAVDLDSVIQILKKMKIKTNLTPAFGPMNQLKNIINNSTILEQVLDNLKPAPKKEGDKYKFFNHNLLHLNIDEIILKYYLGFDKKFHNVDIMNAKKDRIKREQQKNILRRICLSISLIEQILKLRLDENYIEYSQHCYPFLVEDIFNKLTSKTHIHKYTVFCEQLNQQVKVQINLLSTIVTTLQLYKYKYHQISSSLSSIIIKQPVQIQITQKNSILKRLQNKNYQNIADNPKYANRLFLAGVVECINENILKCYQNDVMFINNINTNYYDNLLFQSDNISFQSQNSLEGSVYGIMQLMAQNNALEILKLSLDNYDYPCIDQNIIITFNPIDRYLKTNINKSMKPLLRLYIISCIRRNINNQNINSSFIIFSKAFQCLYQLLDQKSFYLMVVQDLRIWADIITKLLNQLTRNYLENQTKINFLNRIVLFLIKFLAKTKSNLCQREFKYSILQNFMIFPNNIIKQIFQILQLILPDFNKLNHLLIFKTPQKFSNLIIQKCLTRNTFYRNTYHMVFRLVLFLIEDLHKDEIYNLLPFFFTYSTILTNLPKQLKQQQAIILKIKPFKRQNIYVVQQEEIIKNTIFSKQIDQFKYSLRTNNKRFGPNFIYSVYQMFHQFKIYRMAQNQSKNNDSDGIFSYENSIIRKQISFIHTLNCLQSLKFAYQASKNAYFQIFNLLSNVGHIGQNISNILADRYIPKANLRQILQNKHIMKNKFSFLEGLIMFVNRNCRQNPLSRICQFLREIFQIIKQSSNSRNIFDRNKNNYGVKSKSGKRIFSSFSEMIQVDSIKCTNPDHIIKLILNLVSYTSDFIALNRNIPQNAQQITRLLDELKIELSTNSVRHSLSVYLMFLSSILDQYILLSELQSRFYKKSSKDLYKYTNKIHLKSKQTLRQKSMNPWNISQPTVRKGDNSKEQIYQMIQFEKRQKIYIKKLSIVRQISKIVYDCYQNKKNADLYNFSQQMRKNPRLIQNGKYSLQQVQTNINLICSICIKAISGQFLPNQQGLFNENMNKQLFTQINYVLKLIMDNIKYFQRSVSKITIFNLCNAYYQACSNTAIQRCPFYGPHMNQCHSIFTTQSYGQNDTISLQRLSAIDTFTLLSSINQYNFTFEALKTLTQVIKINKQLLNKGRQQPDHQVAQKDGVSKYILRKTGNQLTLDRILEYKKLMCMIYTVFTQQQTWMNQSSFLDINALFLQILNFKQIDFTLQKLMPLKQVQQKLQAVLVFQHQKYSFENNYISPLDLINPLSSSSLNVFSEEKKKIPSNQVQNQREEYLQRQRKHNSQTGIMSVFHFMAYIQHSQFVYVFISILKNGLTNSKIMQRIVGIFLTTNQYIELWDNMFRILSQMCQNFINYSEMLLLNKHMLRNLVLNYNYIVQDGAYMNSFEGLTMFIDQVDPNYIVTHLLDSILEYSSLLLDLCDRCKFMQWKSNHEWSNQREAVLRKAGHLLNKNVLLIASKQFGYLKQIEEAKHQIYQHLNMSKKDSFIKRY